MLSQDKQWLLDEKYGGEKSEGFFADCKRLEAGEPLGYVIGWVPFLDCKIWLDSQPLIPRLETEFWVEKAIVAIQKRAQTNLANARDTVGGFGWGTAEQNESSLSESASTTKILDLCAGSGAIGVAVANALPETHVTFAEIDPAHLPTIGKNLAENDIPCMRYQVFQSDLFETVSGTFDFILSNPPYIDPAIDRAEESVKNHEPQLALYGGEAGMELVAKIIAAAPAKLAPHGQLWLEHEPEQAAAIQTLAADNGFAATHHTDQYNVIRYSVLVLQ